ncbi:hypothetical protein BsWGS_01805 [Bradybaena similaris]
MKNKNVTEFAVTVREICNTSLKAVLLDYIRGYLPRSDRKQFDKITVFNRGEYTARMDVKSRSKIAGRITTPPNSVLATATERLVTICGTRGESMGFSVRGGSEFGLGIYVSHVKAASPAAEAGLRAGDHIIKVNGIDFQCIANSSAVKVLSNTALLNLVVVRCGKIPEWKVARQRVLWYDVSLSRIVSNPPVTESRSTGTQPTLFPERKLVINIGKKSDFIGLNIRGGKEYGIGIYVSRVDAGGLASQTGLAAGDQIIKVNDIDCVSITHGDAVDALRSSTHLIITIRPVGKYPVFKELYAEYTWSDVSSLATTTTSNIIVHNRLVTAPGDNLSGKFSQRTRTRESSIDLSPPPAGSNNIYSSLDLDEALDELSESSEVEPDVCYPGDKDIMFRRNRDDTWQDIDSVSENYAYSRKSWAAEKSDSLRNFHDDSDLSDHVLDYATFLEHAAIKERQEKKEKPQRPETSSFLKDDTVVIETVIEDKVTSFTSNPNTSSFSESDESVSETSNQIYSQVQDLTGKTRPGHSRSSTSSSSHSIPIYATVNKRSSSNNAESMKELDEVSFGVRSSDNRMDNGDREETIVKEVIASQIERLEARKSSLGTKEITRVTEGSVSSKSSVSSYESQEKNKTGTWTSLKKRLKGSLRSIGAGQKKRLSLPSADAYSGNGEMSPNRSLQQKGGFERSFGSQILNPQSADRYNLMGMLEDHARVLLMEDEYKAVLRHIHNYHENKDLDRLVELLLAILDKPEKKFLLVDVRNVIAPSHIARFDSLIAQCNVEGYDKWLTKFNSTDGLLKKQTSQNSFNSHEKSRSYDVSHHQPEHVIPFSKTDFENLPGSLEVVVVENDAAENRQNPIIEAGEEIVYISKHKTILGLEITGGRNDPNDQSIRVYKIIAQGAASDDKRLKPGVQITKVDGKSLQGLSCDEAKSILQIAFSTKIPVNLGIHIKRV